MTEIDTKRLRAIIDAANQGPLDKAIYELEFMPEKSRALLDALEQARATIAELNNSCGEWKRRAFGTSEWVEYVKPTKGDQEIARRLAEIDEGLSGWRVDLANGIVRALVAARAEAEARIAELEGQTEQLRGLLNGYISADIQARQLENDALRARLAVAAEATPEGWPMDAYYYWFTSTGVAIIDRILSAVACAGKAYHLTEDWNDDASLYPHLRGKTPIDWIQNAAEDARAALAEIDSGKAQGEGK